MPDEDAQHTDSSEAAHAAQEDKLNTELDTAATQREAKERDWEEGAEKVHTLDDDPPDRKEDFPTDGKSEFETLGEGDEPPEGSPGHDGRGGIISGS